MNRPASRTALSLLICTLGLLGATAPAHAGAGLNVSIASNVEIQVTVPGSSCMYHMDRLNGLTLKRRERRGIYVEAKNSGGCNSMLRSGEVGISWHGKTSSFSFEGTPVHFEISVCPQWDARCASPSKVAFALDRGDWQFVKSAGADWSSVDATSTGNSFRFDFNLKPEVLARQEAKWTASREKLLKEQYGVRTQHRLSPPAPPSFGSSGSTIAECANACSARAREPGHLGCAGFNYDKRSKQCVGYAFGAWQSPLQPDENTDHYYAKPKATWRWASDAAAAEARAVAERLGRAKCAAAMTEPGVEPVSGQNFYLRSMQGEANCEANGRFMDYLSWTIGLGALRDDRKVPWRLEELARAPRRGDLPGREFYLRIQGPGAERLNEYLSWQRAESRVRVHATDKVRWKLVPVAGKAGQFYVQSRYGCPTDAFCDKFVSLKGTVLVLGSDAEKATWKLTRR